MTDNDDDFALGQAAARHCFGKTDDPSERAADGLAVEKADMQAGAAAARRWLGKAEPPPEEHDVYAERETMVRARADRMRAALPQRSVALPHGSLLGHDRL